MKIRHQQSLKVATNVTFGGKHIALTFFFFKVKRKFNYQKLDLEVEKWVGRWLSGQSILLPSDELG